MITHISERESALTHMLRKTGQALDACTAERDALKTKLHDEQERILKICYEQCTPYGKPGECVWIGIKSHVRNLKC